MSKIERFSYITIAISFFWLGLIFPKQPQKSVTTIHWANTPATLITDKNGHYDLGFRSDGVVVYRKAKTNPNEGSDYNTQ